MYTYIYVYTCIHIYIPCRGHKDCPENESPSLWGSDTHTYTHANTCMYVRIYLHTYLWMYVYTLLGRLVGSLKSQVSFVKETYKRDDILQKRPIILRSLLFVATPYLVGIIRIVLGRNLQDCGDHAIIVVYRCPYLLRARLNNIHTYSCSYTYMETTYTRIHVHTHIRE